MPPEAVPRHPGFTGVTVPVQLGFRPFSGFGLTWLLFSEDKPAAGEGFANAFKGFFFIKKEFSWDHSF